MTNYLYRQCAECHEIFEGSYTHEICPECQSIVWKDWNPPDAEKERRVTQDELVDCLRILIEIAFESRDIQREDGKLYNDYAYGVEVLSRWDRDHKQENLSKYLYGYDSGEDV